MYFFKKTYGGFLSYLLVLWVLGFCLFATSVYFYKPQDGDRVTDAIIVFTGGTNRVEEGLRLFAHGRASHLYISGVHNDVALEEITGQWKGDIALPPCCLSLDYASKNTIDNALETAMWVKGNRYRVVRLITSDYHMPRAVIELRHAMPDVTILVHPVKDIYVGQKFHSKPWQILFLEYHKALFRYVHLLFIERHSLYDSGGH